MTMLMTPGCDLHLIHPGASGDGSVAHAQMIKILINTTRPFRTRARSGRSASVPAQRGLVLRLRCGLRVLRPRRCRCGPRGQRRAAAAFSRKLGETVARCRHRVIRPFGVIETRVPQSCTLTHPHTHKPTHSVSSHCNLLLLFILGENQDITLILRLRPPLWASACARETREATASGDGLPDARR